MKYGLSQHDIELLRNVFKQFSEVREAVLFGSRAMGNFKKGSDVDIALKGNVDHSTLSAIKSLLEEELPLPFFFDILLYNEIESKDLLAHIKKHGQIIYSQIS